MIVDFKSVPGAIVFVSSGFDEWRTLSDIHQHFGLPGFSYLDSRDRTLTITVSPEKEVDSLQGELNDVKSELEGELNDVKSELEGELNDVKSELEEVSDQLDHSTRKVEDFEKKLEGQIIVEFVI